MISTDARNRHQAWRTRVRDRLCIRAGSADDRCLTRIILAWRTLRASVDALHRHGHPVSQVQRDRLAQLERVLGEHEGDHAELEDSAAEAA